MISRTPINSNQRIQISRLVHGNGITMGWDGTARIAFSMNDNECQNDNELWALLNFKVNKVSKFCRFVSLFVRVVLSSTHYTKIFSNSLTFIEIYFDGNPIGWDKHELLWNEMGWNRKICLMNKPANIIFGFTAGKRRKTLALKYIQCQYFLKWFIDKTKTLWIYNVYWQFKFYRNSSVLLICNPGITEDIFEFLGKLITTEYVSH